MTERKNEISPSTESRKACSSALSPGRDTVIVRLFEELGMLVIRLANEPESHGKSSKYCLAPVSTFNTASSSEPNTTIPTD
jgi:hypothetical protein